MATNNDIGTNASHIATNITSLAEGRLSIDRLILSNGKIDPAFIPVDDLKVDTTKAGFMTKEDKLHLDSLVKASQTHVAGVSSVNGQSGSVTIDKNTLGLANVDNTRDLDKPISNSTQSALNEKAPLHSPTFTGTVSGIDKYAVGLSNVDNTSDVNKPISQATQTVLDQKANILNPHFQGTVTGITKSMVGLSNVDNTSDADKPISTATRLVLDTCLKNTDKELGTGFDTLNVGKNASNLLLGDGATNVTVGSTNSTVNLLGTLKGISVATVSGLTEELNKKATLDSPTFTGTPTTVTPEVNTLQTSTQLANVAFVHNVLQNRYHLKPTNGPVPDPVNPDDVFKGWSSASKFSPASSHALAAIEDGFCFGEKPTFQVDSHAKHSSLHNVGTITPTANIGNVVNIGNNKVNDGVAIGNRLDSFDGVALFHDTHLNNTTNYANFSDKSGVLISSLGPSLKRMDQDEAGYQGLNVLDTWSTNLASKSIALLTDVKSTTDYDNDIIIGDGSILRYQGHGNKPTKLISLGHLQKAEGTITDSIILGNESKATKDHQVSIGSETNTRFISFVKDPLEPQDAATKAYVDSKLTNSTSNINTYKATHLQTSSDSETVTLDLSVASEFYLTLGHHNCQLQLDLSHLETDQRPSSTNTLIFILNITNGGQFGFTWSSDMLFALGEAPTLSTNATDVIAFKYDCVKAKWVGFMIAEGI